MSTLTIKNLKAEVEGLEILKGINLELNLGEVHALMGPNGSGKSTLSNVIMGHPRYTVTQGEVLLDGENILEMEVHERARKGLFLAFQYPVEVPGLRVGKFLKRAAEIQLETKGEKMNVTKFLKDVRSHMDYLEMDHSWLNRYLNEGFSGGEKKRMEILQLLTLSPKYAIFDETDSGLDVDALKVVSKGINHLRGEGFGGMIITHYQRILNYIRPDKVHIMYKGKIVTSGGNELVDTLEESGYDAITESLGIREDDNE